MSRRSRQQARLVIAEIRGRGRDAGAGRRIGALHPCRPRPVRLPRDRPAVRARWEEEFNRIGAARTARRPRRARPRGGGGDHPRERPPDRPRPRGHRADRRARTRPPCRSRSTRPAHRPDRRRHRPRRARSPDRGASGRDVRGRLRRGGRAAARGGSRRRAHRLSGDRLPRGGRLPRGEVDRDEAREATKAATRRFARRQDGWFRKDPRVVWVRTTTPNVSSRRAVGGAAPSRWRRDDAHDLLHRHHARRVHRRRPGLLGLALRSGPGRSGAAQLRRVPRRPRCRLHGRHDLRVDLGTSTRGRWSWTLPMWVFTHRDLPPRGSHLRPRRRPRGARSRWSQAAGGKDLWVVGGGDLAGQFADAGLLDEVITYIAPVTLGSGGRSCRGGSSSASRRPSPTGASSPLASRWSDPEPGRTEPPRLRA